MAYVSHEYRMLFFAVPATGSTAFIKALQDRGIGEFLPEESLYNPVKVPSKHSTPAQLERAGLMEPVRDYLMVAGVRNLFSWLVAKHVRNTTLRKKNLNNQKSWIYRKPEPERSRVIARVKEQAEMDFGTYVHRMCGKSGYPMEPYHNVDFVIHQEDSASDFAELRDRVGLPGDMILPLRNVTGKMPEGKTWRDFYTPELKAIVAASPFFDRFPEYSFDC